MLRIYLARCRWLSLALSILLAAGSCFCAYYWLGYEYSSGSASRFYAFTENGGIAFGWVDSSMLPIDQWTFTRQFDERGVWRLRAAAIGRTSNYKSATFVPLAPVAVVLAAASIFGFKSFKYPAGHCRRCGYDLRSLPPGKCPECGHPNEAAQSAATRA